MGPKVEHRLLEAYHFTSVPQKLLQPSSMKYIHTYISMDIQRGRSLTRMELKNVMWNRHLWILCSGEPRLFGNRKKLESEKNHKACTEMGCVKQHLLTPAQRYLQWTVSLPSFHVHGPEINRMEKNDVSLPLPQTIWSAEGVKLVMESKAQRELRSKVVLVLVNVQPCCVVPRKLMNVRVPISRTFLSTYLLENPLLIPSLLGMKSDILQLNGSC